jgi:phosphatidylglycerol:prolipoprotein diacylglycerol transferase
VFPVLFEIYGWPIPTWHVMYCLGALAAYYLFIGLAERYAPSVWISDLNRLYGIAYIGGYGGARLFSVLVDEGVWQPSAIFLRLLVPGAMTFYGGLCGALLFGVGFVWFRALPLGALWDAAAPAGFLALAIGRVGCFLNGDDYGISVAPGIHGEPAPWWAVVFTNHSNPLPRGPARSSPR